MTAPTQQARAAILAEACHALRVKDEYHKLFSDAHNYGHKRLAEACLGVVGAQCERLAKAEADLAKLEGEAP